MRDEIGGGIMNMPVLILGSGGHAMVTFRCHSNLVSTFTNRGYGNIVNMASIYGVDAPRFEIYADTPMTMPVEYAAIKSAVIHLTKYLAKYIKGDNIRVNCISPGGILAWQPQEFLDAYPCE